MFMTFGKDQVFGQLDAGGEYVCLPVVSQVDHAGTRGWLVALQVLGRCIPRQTCSCCGEKHSLDNAAGLGVHIKQVVGKTKAGVEGEFADSHALDFTGPGVDVGIRHITHKPTGCN